MKKDIILTRNGLIKPFNPMNGDFDITLKHEIELEMKFKVAYDSVDNVLGKGFIYISLASEIYEKDRYNIFIDMDINQNDNNEHIKDFILRHLIQRANQIRERYKDFDVRVYHCCFSHDTEAIQYYKKQKGFKHDEGMYIIRHDLDIIPQCDVRLQDTTIVEDRLSNEEEITAFIEEHRIIFRAFPYTVQKIIKLKEEHDFKSITIMHENKIIANILLYVTKESDKSIGWVEDMFVSKAWRNKGIGSFILVEGLKYFKSKGVDESRLEVWSANKRAMNLYHKIGYRFYQETELSIGMFI